MGKLKPLAKLENGAMRIDPKKMKNITMKFQDSNSFEDWILQQIVAVAQIYNEGRFLFFARLNPLGVKIFLITEGECQEPKNKISLSGTFRGSKWRKPRL